MKMKMITNGFPSTLLSITNQCFEVHMFFIKFRCDSLSNSVFNIGMYVNTIVQPLFSYRSINKIVLLKVKYVSK